MKKKIIGVTGGLATGKTTVADMFVDKGAFKIDADKIVHKLLVEDKDIKGRIIDAFGKDILADDEIDRRKLAKVVFFDRKELDKLCAILHPEVIRNIKEETEGAQQEVIVIDAPLLIETKLHDFVDIVVVVTASYENQIKRARERGISEQVAKNVIANQLPLTEKVELADYIIDNDGDPNKTKEGVDKIWLKV